jgi:hypothetical protein
VYTLLQLITVYTQSSHYIFTGCLSSNIAGSVRLQLCNSSLKTAARPQYLLVTANSSAELSPETTTLRLNWLAGAHGYTAREQTTKKTLPRNRPQREHGCPYCCLGKTTKKTLVASIVACLSVAIATVVNTCHIVYTMHVTILIKSSEKANYASCSPNSYLWMKKVRHEGVWECGFIDHLCMKRKKNL